MSDKLYDVDGRSVSRQVVRDWSCHCFVPRRERDLHKATNAALRQNVKKLHDDLNEREVNLIIIYFNFLIVSILFIENVQQM